MGKIASAMRELLSEADKAAGTYPATKAGARKFLDDALAGVESASIRKWATSENNRSVWEEEALARIKAGKADVTRFTTSIVTHAMGM